MDTISIKTETSVDDLEIAGTSSMQDLNKIVIPNFHVGSEPIKQDNPEHVEKSLQEIGFNANNIVNSNMAQPPKTKLNKLLKAMINSNTMPDVQICIGDQEFPCHMLVLQCYSNFFRRTTHESVIQLPAEKVTPQAFIKIYNWMLAETPSVQPEGLLELFVAARYLDIGELIEQCWTCFADDECFREFTAFHVYLEAQKAQQTDLEQLMLMRISKFFLTVVASIEFLELSHKAVCSLLNSSTIGVNSEIDILMSAVRWLTYAWEERKKYQMDLVQTIRFKLMPSWYLVTLYKNFMSPELRKVLALPEVHQMLLDAMSYVACKDYFINNEDKLQKFLRSMRLTIPAERTWIIDPLCTHHNCITNQNMKCSTYEAFNAYLEEIRSLGTEHWRQVELAKDA